MYQYFTPEGEFYVGDCMPFWHDGVFHLYYLLDQEHHKARGGLGCHQWAHASTRDLVHWEHHPLALPVEHEWEGSICTGSVYWHEGLYCAFYATRMPNWDQHLCLAASEDGIHFEKAASNPFASPEAGYSPKHYRDPVVFRDESTGLFHLLASAELEHYAIPERGGCLAHLVSADLRDWRLEEPFLIPGYMGIPECPDYFEWNGWYYLIFSNYGVARYRRSRNPLGPWEAPPVDSFDGPMSRVMKTAQFGGKRRIGAAFVPCVEGDRDDGGMLYAGNVVFREIIQEADGTLWSGFVPEMTPVVSGEGRQAELASVEGLEVRAMGNFAPDVHIKARLVPHDQTAAYGFCVRGEGNFASGYQIRLSPQSHCVEICRTNAGPNPELSRHAVVGVDGLDEAVSVEVTCQGDIVDVCVNGRHCLVARLPELRGGRVSLFCQNGAVRCEGLWVTSLV